MFSYTPLPLTHENHGFAIAHNRAELATQLRTNDLNMNRFWWLSEDNLLLPPGTHNLHVHRYSDDLVCATIVGGIAYATGSGVDALVVEENDEGEYEFVEIECKLSYVSKNKILVSNNLSLQMGNPHGGKNTRTSFRSRIAATYEIVNNLHKKNMKTFLVVMDTDTREIINVSMLKGDAIEDCLATNVVTGEARTSKKRSIKLSKFYNDGVQINPIGFKVVGLCAWEQNVVRAANRRVGAFWMI